MRKKLAEFLEISKVKLKLNDAFLLAMPIIIWFGYYPIIPLGSDHSMNLELSLVEIFLLLFAITALPRIWQNRQKLMANKAVWLVTAFALWNTLSLAWTPNLLRGLLTAGLVWLLALALFGILSNKNLKKLLPALFKLLVVSAVVMSVFAWLQVIVGTLTNSNDLLLCSGCTASMFGFARATGFAIEPQFFGSLLLAPILLLCHLKFIEKKSRIKLSLLIIFLMSTLFLTLSRGAIYAFVLGLLVLLVLNYKQFKKVLTVIGLTVGSFLITLFIQGVLAQANPSLNETFVGATTKTIHQLSLGIIDLRPQECVPSSSAAIIAEEPVYDGYIEESTDIRLSLSQVALNTWVSSPLVTIFGSGVGSSGLAMNTSHPDQVGTKEIVQNEYIEILLELGLVGFLIFVAIVVGLFYATRKQKWLWAIIISFLTQWLFFSGYPNALHTYFILAICVAISRLTQ